MSISSNLKSLDKLVTKGKIIEAFDKYFHDEVITFSSDTDKTKSKKEKLILLKDFFTNIASKDQIKFHDHIKSGSYTYSKFTFIFTNNQHERLKWHEIIRRKWQGEKVIEEYYYHEKFSKLKERIEKELLVEKTKKKKATAKKKTDKKDSSKSIERQDLVLQSVPKPKAQKSTKEVVQKESVAPVKKVGTPKTTTSKSVVKKALAAKSEEIKEPLKKEATSISIEKKATISKTTPAKKVSLKSVTAPQKASTSKNTTLRKPRTRKAPDLTIVEGIGPKIKELLGLAGIKTFAELAKANPDQMKAILLEKGGTRYNIHDPTTWPEQAALARDDKWEELDKLKNELKGGKR